MGFGGPFLNVVNMDSWALRGEDGSVIEGQFHAEDLTENISARYETHTTISRQTPNVQFINGEPRTITFKARLFQHSALPIDGNAAAAVIGEVTDNQTSFTALKEKLNKLKEWTRVDDNEKRPPILSFSIGDGTEISMEHCVITSLGGISYARPRHTGGMRDVTLTITLLEYNEYKLEARKTETRYHNVSEGEYYELLTFREYNSPQMGDVIRKRHPEQPVVKVGDTVKLPSFEAIDTEKVTQTSIALKTGWGKRSTPQKELRKEVLDERNRTYISHVILED